MDFLNNLCENAWFDGDDKEAGQILELFADEINDWQYHLLLETIFGPNMTPEYSDEEIRTS